MNRSSNPSPLFRALIGIGLSLGLLIGALSVQAAKLYKWVDSDGNISYQDTPPPANAKLLQESTITVSSPTESDDSGTPITVYTVENCPPCVQLTGRLRELEIPFSEQSLMDRDVQAEIIDASESLTAPTIKIGDQYLSGLSDAALLTNLQDAGYEPKQEAQPATDEFRAPSELE